MSDWVTFAEKFGLPFAILLALIWSGAHQWWVFGWQYKAKDREAAEWKDLALRGTRLAELSTDLAALPLRRRDGL